MDVENEKKALSDFAMLIGFIMGTFIVTIIPLIIAGNVVNNQYIEMVAIISSTVVPVVTLIIPVAMPREGRSYLRRLCIGTNLGNVLSVIMIDFEVTSRDIELAGNVTGRLNYAFFVSLLVAAVLVLWEISSKKYESEN